MIVQQCYQVEQPIVSQSLALGKAALQIGAKEPPVVTFILRCAPGGWEPGVDQVAGAGPECWSVPEVEGPVRPGDRWRVDDWRMIR